MRFLFILFFILSFFVPSVFSSASSDKPSGGLDSSLPLFEEGFSGESLEPDPMIHSGVLENGLRYAILRNTVPKEDISIRFLVNLGSFDEREGEFGFAHLIEHMAFNGTRNFPKGELIDL